MPYTIPNACRLILQGAVMLASCLLYYACVAVAALCRLLYKYRADAAEIAGCAVVAVLFLAIVLVLPWLVC